MTEKTKTKWTSTTNGVYCEIEYTKTKDQTPNDITRAFYNQLKECGIQFPRRDNCLTIERAVEKADWTPESIGQFKVKVNITFASDLQNLSRTLAKATNRSTPLGGTIEVQKPDPMPKSDSIFCPGQWVIKIDSNTFTEIKAKIEAIPQLKKSYSYTYSRETGELYFKPTSNLPTLIAVREFHAALISSGIISNDENIQFRSNNRWGWCNQLGNENDYIFTSDQLKNFTEARLKTLISLYDRRDEIINHSNLTIENINEPENKYSKQKLESLTAQIKTVRNEQVRNNDYEKARDFVEKAIDYKTKRTADTREYSGWGKFFGGSSRKTKLDTVTKLVKHYTGETPNPIFTEKEFKAYNNGELSKITGAQSLKLQVKKEIPKANQEEPKLDTKSSKRM